MNQPPSYEAVGGSTAPSYNPPSYEDATVQPSPPRELPAEELPTLLVEDCQIYSQKYPEHILYEISNPPCEATTKLYGIEKVRYRVVDEEGGEGEVRSRRDHIYDFKEDLSSTGLRDVQISGKASSKRAFRDVKMSQGINALSFSVSDYFKAGPMVGDPRRKIAWKQDGKIVAIETRPERAKDGKITTLPQLEVKIVLEEKLLDLLVTCWCARLWTEAEKELKEPLTWSKFKRIASAKTDGGSSSSSRIGGAL